MRTEQQKYEFLHGILLRAFFLSSSSYLNVTINAQIQKLHHNCVCLRKRSTKAQRGLFEMLKVGFLYEMKGTQLPHGARGVARAAAQAGVWEVRGRERPRMNPHTLNLDSLKDPELCAVQFPLKVHQNRARRADAGVFSYPCKDRS